MAGDNDPLKNQENGQIASNGNGHLAEPLICANSGRMWIVRSFMQDDYRAVWKEQGGGSRRHRMQISKTK